MKKLCLALLVMSGLAFAANKNCSDVTANQVVGKLAKFNKTSVTINYSSDSTTLANQRKSEIMALNNKLTVNLNPVSGTGVCNFSK